MNSRQININHIIIGAITTSSISLLSWIAQQYISAKEPTLKYEILPISSFHRDSIQLSIFNVRVLNDGRKECEDVVLQLLMKQRVSFEDYTLEKSSKSIVVNEHLDSLTQIKYFSIPYLNPKEQIIFSFLVNKKIENDDVGVDLRSKGLNGILLERRESSISILLFFATLGMLSLTIGLITFIIFHQRKIIRHQLLLSQLEEQKYKSIISELGLDWEEVNYRHSNKINSQYLDL